MHWEVRPLEGIGPVRLGSTLADVEALLSSLPGYTGGDGRGAKPSTQFTFDSGLGVGVGPDATGTVIAVEVYGSDADEVTYDGVDVFRTPASDLIAWLQTTTEVEIEEEGSSVTATALSLGFWRQCVPEHDGDEEGKFFMTVLAAHAGYYSPPPR